MRLASSLPTQAQWDSRHFLLRHRTTVAQSLRYETSAIDTGACGFRRVLSRDCCKVPRQNSRDSANPPTDNPFGAALPLTESAFAGMGDRYIRVRIEPLLLVTRRAILIA